MQSKTCSDKKKRKKSERKERELPQNSGLIKNTDL